MADTSIAEPPPSSDPRPHGGSGSWLLALGALGVVYGDIGTSPLYALQTVFSIGHGAVRSTAPDVYGIASLVFWSITLIVAIKYVTFVMRADNDGEGGVLALSALVQRVRAGRPVQVGALVVVGLLGACLFYGDSIITPAISVLSAIQGLDVPYPGLARLVVPLSAVVLAVLFAFQRWGTHRVGALFGPVMVAWFVMLAAAGIRGISMHPGVLAGLSPSYGLAFVGRRPGEAFVALGAVVLAITGAEALYADMGHFGPRAIRKAWFFLVFPALTLNYLGQSGLIIAHPHDRVDPFFLLLPGWFQVPAVLISTVATVIASQAVISGAFSMTRQAVQLGYLPPMTVRHTSDKEAGQIYLPFVNWVLFVGVMVLVFAFRNSNNLANAYGIAVTGTFVLTTTMLVVLARSAWHWPAWRLVAIAVLFGLVEVVFFAGNIVKVVSGGWLPLLVALVLFTTMTTWRKGRQLVIERRMEKEGSLADFVDHARLTSARRVPGTAVCPHPSKATTPLALRANLEHNRVLHQQVVIVSTVPRAVPRVLSEDRLSFDDLGYADDGIVHVTLNFGFSDTPDIPAALAADPSLGGLIVPPEPDTTSYLVSRATLSRSGRRGGMAGWRKRLFIAMAHNAADPAETFRLPADRTVVMGSKISI